MSIRISSVNESTDHRRSSGTVKLGSMLARFDNALKVKHKPVEHKTINKSIESTTPTVNTPDEFNNLFIQQQFHAAQLIEQQKQQQQADAELAEQQRILDEQQVHAELQLQAEQAELDRVQQLHQQQLIQAELDRQAEIDRINELEQEKQYELVKQQAIIDEKQRIMQLRNQQYQLKLQYEQEQHAIQLHEYEQYGYDCYKRGELYYIQRNQRHHVTKWYTNTKQQQYNKLRSINYNKRINKLQCNNLISICYRHWLTLYKCTQHYRHIVNTMGVYRAKQSLFYAFNQWKQQLYTSKQLIHADQYCYKHTLLRTIRSLMQHTRSAIQYKHHQQLLIDTLQQHHQQTNRSQVQQCMIEWNQLLHTIRQRKTDELLKQQQPGHQRVIVTEHAELLAQQLTQHAEQQRIINEHAAIEQQKHNQLLQQQKQQRIADKLAKQAAAAEQQRIQVEQAELLKQQKLADIESKRIKRELQLKQQKHIESIKQQQLEQDELIRSLAADHAEIQLLNDELESILIDEQSALQQYNTIQSNIIDITQSITQVKSELHDAIDAELKAEHDAEEQRILEQKRIKLLHVLFDPMVKKKSAAVNKQSIKPVR